MIDLKIGSYSKGHIIIIHKKKQNKNKTKQKANTKNGQI